MMNCWEFMGCGREASGSRVRDLGLCPTWPHHGHHCAYIAGTLSPYDPVCIFVRHVPNCMTCDYYRSSHFEHPPASGSGPANPASPSRSAP
jgi:hypothetical protein